MFLEAEERLKSAERLESLLRNRCSLLVRRGLESLEVESVDLSKAPPPNLVVI